MKWTKSLAETFLSLVSATEETNQNLEKFCMTNGIANWGADVQSAANIYLLGVAEGIKIATPAPTPISTALVIKEPTALENMVKNVDGVYETTAGFLAPGKSSSANIQFDLLGKVDYKKTVTFQIRRWSDIKVGPTGNAARPDYNVKLWRFWNRLIAGQLDPNGYIGVPDLLKSVADQDWQFHIESFYPWTRFKNHFSLVTKPWPFGDAKWHDEKVTIVYPSGYGASDGSIKAECDGKVMLDSGPGVMQMNGGPMIRDGKPFDAPGLFSLFCAQLFFADNVFPAGSAMRIAEPQLTIE